MGARATRTTPALLLLAALVLLLLCRKNVESTRYCSLAEYCSADWFVALSVRIMTEDALVI